ncbi:hypothetical protein QVD17_03340 [Tagetes erecta]|uniref:Transcription repressor n=1 Tax=Tagetes erecta TaxID=13708 RepID=A0AAD8LED4_TARER|nr:hypothetical protein QVD17_03340 [Tagetes erecta]
MENQFKSQISKLFQSTFNSCRQKTTSDVSDHRIFHRKTPDRHRLIDLFSPKPQPQSSSTSKPKPHLHNLKNTTFPASSGDRKSYSVSPIHEKTSKTDRKKKTHHRRRRTNASFSSIADNYYHNWWSSDENDQIESKSTLFSRRSNSLDSIESHCGNVEKRRLATNVVAIAKDSNDPYEDFKASMVDMIVEEGIFGVEELEKLVECFVSLNSEEYHKVIFDVFAEIWEILIQDMNKTE